MGLQIIPALIFGVIGLAVILILWNVVQPSNAEVFNQFVNNCQLSGKAVTRLVATAPAAQAGLTTNITGTGAVCSATAANAAVTAYADEYGRTYTAASGVPDVSAGTYRSLPTFMERFAAINRLLASVLPVLYVIGILGQAYSVYQGGGGGIMQNLLLVLGKTIAYVVGVVLLPVLIGLVATAAAGNASGAGLAVNDLLGSIVTLLWNLTPTLLLLGLMLLAPVGTGFYGAVGRRARGYVGGGGFGM